MKRGWWRRNLWGLILVVPLAAGLFALNAGEIYERNFTALPKRAVPIDSTGRAVLDSYTVRTIEVTPVESAAQIKDLVGIGAALPNTVKVWRAILSISAPADSFVSLCEVALVDSQGRAYTSGPSELAQGGNHLCVADDEKQPTPYVTTFYFLLPTQARPAGLRITWQPLLPRFILFPLP